MRDRAAVTYWQDFTTRHQFPVVFGRGLLAPDSDVLLNALCIQEPEKRHKILVVVDAGLAEAVPDLISRIVRHVDVHSCGMELICQPIVLPGGESVKDSDRFFWELMQKVQTLGVDRHSYVISIGGGSLLDLVGFVAATAHRGIRHIRMPTTVLAQCDSGVGVKNAINFGSSKNFTGTFAPPWAVLNDFDFLDVLPPRERISGMAEAVKVSLIRDREFFLFLESAVDRLAKFEREPVETLVLRSAELHMAQISRGGDPFENGSSRPLDFGHWAAHRLEVLSAYELRHGEAVAIGLALDAHYSALIGLLSTSDCERIVDVLNRLGFSLWHPALLEEDANGRRAVLKGLRQFQEHLGGCLTITLLSELGTGVDVHEIDEDTVLEAIGRLRERFAA